MMKHKLPESDSNSSRRAVLQASLFASISAGCTSNTSPFLTYIKSRSAAIRLITPWSRSLQTIWEKDFTDWIQAKNLAAIKVSWMVVSENELSRIAPERLTQLSDGLIGGHSSIHHRLQSMPATTQGLKPVRVPVISKFATDQPSSVPVKRSVIANQNKSWSNLGSPNDWPTSDQVLKLADPQTDLLSQVYTNAVLQSAPDQATGFARWIRLARQVQPMEQLETAKSAKLSLESIAKNEMEVWRGPPALITALGMTGPGPIYWPECLSLWKSSQTSAQPVDSFQQFCSNTNRLTDIGDSKVSEPTPRAITNDLASITLFECRRDLQKAWETIENSTGELRQRAEKYLTELPPWPPASIQDLQKRRGFEYVVALVEQMAADGDERDWLIREFQNQESKVNLQSLDQALDGQIQVSTRFRAWLHAEWTAWIRQRCRRVTRYLTDL